MTGTITSLGIGAGLDTQSIVDQLIAAEREPKELRIARDEARIQAELSAFGVLAAEMDKLGTAARGLRGQSDTRTASFSVEGFISANLGSTAVTGSFSVTVNRLAAAQTLVSGEFAERSSTVGTGTLNLSVGDENVDVTIDSSNNSVGGIAAAINEATDAVRAQVLNTGTGVKLMLTSATTGIANEINLSVTDGDGNSADDSGLSQLTTGALSLSESEAAADASLSFNGQTVTSSTNTFEDVVEGVDITALKADENQPITMTVARDQSAAVESVAGLARVLSSLSTGLRSQMGYNPETQVAGLLQGDATARALDQRISDILSQELGSGTLRNLVDIGVGRSLEGEVTVDRERLNQALEEDFEAVSNLLEAAAESIITVVDGFGRTSGILGSRTEALQERLEGIDDRRARLEEQIATTEARIRRQFAGLDTLIAQLQNTSNFLATQLGNLPVPGRSNNN